MGTNATDWLNAHGFGCEPVEGPALLEPIPELLLPGDVDEDGAILCADDTTVLFGAVYVSAPQVAAAAYYGWTRILHLPIRRCELSGRLVYAISRLEKN